MEAILLGLTLAASILGLPQETQDDPTKRGAEVFDDSEEVVELGYANRHALVIGIDDYEDSAFPDLSYAVKDAEGVAKVLVERFGFEPERVRLIRNEEATKQGLGAALDDWATDPGRIGEHDLVVIFFAGHGVTRDLGKERKRGYLVPVDARTTPDGSNAWSTHYRMTDLDDVSEAIPAKHVLVILDCCFSGLAVNRSAPVLIAGLSQRARQVITAGNENQTVQDGGGGGHSVFTGALLDGLRGTADLDGDEVITFGELFNHIGETVENATAQRQIPLQHVLPDHRGGNVALFRPGTRPDRMTVQDRLDALKLSAEELAEEMLGYEDALLIQDLLEEADMQLWPRRSHMVPRYRAWLAKAAPLLSRQVEHEEARLRVRQQAYLEMVLAGLAEEGAGAPVDWSVVGRGLRFRNEKLGELEAACADLEMTIGDVEDRLSFAETIRARTIEAHEEEWDEAINDIALGEVYEGFELEEIEGLVPIGVDPDSGLWEFWHVESGARPERDPETEQIVLSEDMGMVLVLIPVPGGTTTIGSQRSEPDAPYYDLTHQRDEALRDVALEPYLLSKYEMTQGQWRRLTGSNPSFFHPPRSPGGAPVSLLHPVETVSWAMCHEVLARFGLDLPSEAQWEHGARAGTTTPWWTGSRKESLDGAANLGDRRFEASFVGPQGHEDWLDDGHPFHAPVGSYRGNAFGLFDVHGNVWEWCLDEYLGGSAPEPSSLPGLDQSDPEGGSRAAGARRRVRRGGAYVNPASNNRSAFRYVSAPGLSDNALGVRPARVTSK